MSISFHALSFSCHFGGKPLLESQKLREKITKKETDSALPK